VRGVVERAASAAATRGYRIAKLERIERADNDGRGEDATDDGPPL